MNLKRKASSVIAAWITRVATASMLGLASASAVAASGLQVSLSTDATRFAASTDVVVRVTLTNPTASTLRVLAWQTPAKGLEESLFDVTLDGVPATYLGKHVKRSAPTAQDYLTVSAGQRLAYEVDLSRYYAFTDSGSYVITYDSAFGDLAGPSNRLLSNALVVDVAGRGEIATPTPAIVFGGSTTFNGCDASRQTALNQARTNASTYAADATTFFNNNRAGARYVKWFGVFNGSRWANVKNHYALISNAADNVAVHFDCTCTDSYYAYVYANQPYNIYLCNAFWSAPATGTDSKAGTLIHELSHFTILGGTNDFVYGQSGAMSLAISNPANATMNADNHEYFVENTPATADNAAAYRLTNTAHDFGSQGVGSTSAGFPFVLTNSGDANLSVGTLTVSAEFVLSANTCSGALVAAGANCTFSASFAPASQGAKAGSISIPSNSLAAPSSIALTGTGTAAGVTLFMNSFE